MIKFIKNNYHYFILFIFIFLTYSIFVFSNNYGDPIANYGFSYAITRGEIPYVDFNTISTPLYSFVMSIGLFIWNNYSMFLLEHSIAVTVMFYILNKIYGKKAYILLFPISFFFFYSINPTYNFFAFFMMIILLFLEKKYPDKDYLIGVIIGLAILSKHTVGCLFVLPSLIFYFKKKEKILKRFVGLLGVGLLFIIYLLLTNSFMRFIDLCFLGLFDFSSKNGNVFNFWFFVSIICLIISLIITIKNKKNISNYYLLMGISFVIPLFDLNHFAIYIVCITLQFLPFIKKYGDYLGFLSFVFSIIICGFCFFGFYDDFKPVLNKKIKHFEFINNAKNNYNKNIKKFKYFDKYKNPLILSYSKMVYDISRDKDIDYFNVLLYGNFGYNGTNKMIKEIKKMHNRYIIVDMEDYLNKNDNSQFDKDIVYYVISKSKKIECRKKVCVYYRE